MRIGFNIQLKDKYLSGVERYSIGLVNSLQRYYPENEYFIFTNAPEYFKSASKIIVNKNDNRMRRIIWEHTALPKLAEKHNLDILHCPHYICPLRKSIVPYVVTIHDIIALEYPSWCTFSNAIYYRIVLRSAAKIAEKIITVSEETKRKIIKNLSICEKKVMKAYPGLNECFFKNRSKDELIKVKDKYLLPDKYLLYVGNIEPKKNLEHVVDAFRLYRSSDENCALVIVGKRNWKSKKLFSLFRKVEGLVLTGYLEDDELACVYQMANALLFPSKYEGFGFPPLEAMASGIPVICSAKGALRETVSEGVLFIEPNDPVSTYNAIVSLNENNDLREKLITSGHMIANRFSWSAAVRQTFETYREVFDAK